MTNANMERNRELTGGCHPGATPFSAEGLERGSGWKTYWETTRLNDRQRIFREQANEYVRNLLATVDLKPTARVLDFGCGFGFATAALAPHVQEVHIWDASSIVRQRAAANLAGHANVRPIDLGDGRNLPRGIRFDAILVNSVIQYMDLEEFRAWLAGWRRLLRPAGRLIISDIIPPDNRSSWDYAAVLRFSARRGFLLRALWQAVNDLSRYWTMRRTCAYLCLRAEDLRRHGKDAGLAMRLLPRSLTHFRRRLAVLFSPISDA